MKIIGLIGSSGVGKDTLYNEIEKNYNVKRFAQGDLMKESLSEALRFMSLLPVSDATKEYYRPVMIAYAEAMRARVPGIWIDSILPNIIECKDKLAVITDIRNIQTINRLNKVFQVIYFYISRPGKDDNGIEEMLFDNSVPAYQITNNDKPEKMMAVFNHAMVKNGLDVWRKSE